MDLLPLLGEWLDRYQTLKGALLQDGAQCPVPALFPRAALRIYAALGLFLAFAALRRRGLGDWFSFAMLALLACAQELLDLWFMVRRGAASLGSWQIDTGLDLMNSLLLPALLVLYARSRQSSTNG